MGMRDARLRRQLQDTTDKTLVFNLDGMECEAKCTKCYDADTIHVVFPYSGTMYRWTGRLLGIDSAEIRTTDVAEKAHAVDARDYLKSRILDKIVRVKCGKFDKYGRLLVTVFIKEGRGETNINEELVEKGHAYRYDGGKKREFGDWSK